uniref:Uncharacterized protein n=1 Tax=Aegilops tauschii subsp. strangulata TaxID=200361 RepID=A0A453D990_AEGTS
MNKQEASGFIDRTTTLISNLRLKLCASDVEWTDGSGAGVARGHGAAAVVDEQLEGERHVEGEVEHLGLDGGAEAGRGGEPGDALHQRAALDAGVADVQRSLPSRSRHTPSFSVSIGHVSDEGVGLGVGVGGVGAGVGVGGVGVGVGGEGGHALRPPWRLLGDGEPPMMGVTTPMTGVTTPPTAGTPPTAPPTVPTTGETTPPTAGTAPPTTGVTLPTTPPTVGTMPPTTGVTLPTTPPTVGTAPPATGVTLPTTPPTTGVTLPTTPPTVGAAPPMIGVTVPTTPPMTGGMLTPPAEGVPLDGVPLPHPEAGEHASTTVGEESASMASTSSAEIFVDSIAGSYLRSTESVLRGVL